MISESAKKAAQVADEDVGFIQNFLPVHLSPIEAQDYDSYLYPKIPNDDTAPKLGQMFAILSQLNEEASKVNAAYATLRQLISYNSRKVYNYQAGEYSPAKLVEQNIEQRIKIIAADIFQEHLAEYRTKNKFEHCMQMFRSSGAEGAGNPFIIKPSTVAKGGFDIMWIGKSDHSFGSSPLFGVQLNSSGRYAYGVDLDVTYNALTDDTRYKPEVFDKYHNDNDAESIYSAMKKLNQIVTGGHVSVKNATKRNFYSMPLNYNWTQIESIEIQMLGKSIKPFEGLFSKGIEHATKFKNYFSIISIYEPNNSVVQKKIQKMSEGQPFDVNTVREESLVAAPNVSFSIVLHMPENFVHFATQTPKNESVSMVTLSQWVNSWMDYAFNSNLATRTTKKQSKGDVKDKIDASLIEKSKSNYVVSPALLMTFAKKRQAMNYYTEKGNTDSNNMMVASDGTMIHFPKAEQLDTLIDNAKEYDRICSEALKQFYDLNCCANFSTTYLPNTIAAENDSLSIKDALSKKVESVKSVSGVLLAGTWDYNTMIYAGGDPSRTKTLKLHGTVPNELALKDYIDRPFLQAISNVVEKSPGSRFPYTPDKTIAETILDTIVEMYNVLFELGKVKSFQELVNDAKAHFNIKALDDEKFVDFEGALYTSVLQSPQLNELPGLDAKEGNKVRAMLQDVLNNSRVEFHGRDTSLRQALGKIYTDAESRDNEVRNSNRYFLGGGYRDDSKLSDFKNVYNWFGGYVYYLMLKQIKDLPSNVLYGIKGRKFPSAQRLSTVEMPYIAMMTAYVPNADTIYRRAEELAERNQPNENYTIDDLKVLGTKEGAQQFPHGVKAQQTLSNRPQFAALDIQAGGGKTIITCCDIAVTIRKSTEVIRPLVIAPGGLVKNWCEDFNRIVDGKWNYIPLTTETVKRWGFKRLDTLLRNAPENTIVITSMSFLSKANKYAVVIGSELERNSMSVEFIKNYGFNYIAIDECHKVKSLSSSTHKLCKQICNMSTVKYVRLLSGTMIPNITKDIVGIAGMFSGHIFRGIENFERMELEFQKQKEKEQQGEVAVARSKGQRIRDRLKETVALVTIKRKEWAFMLPSPIERFIPVFLSHGEIEQFVKGGKTNNDSTDDDNIDDVSDLVNSGLTTEEILSNAHRKLYRSILQQDVKELFDVIEKPKDSEGDSFEEKFDDAVSGMGDTGKYYFQRIDRIIMDPESDPTGKELFEKLRAAGIDTSKFVSRKVQKIIDCIREHYTPNEWSPKEYESYDTVDYKGKFYSLKRQENGAYTSKMPPDSDENWVEDKRGKVMVVTRYNESAEAVYRNLPHDLKAMAVTLCGNNSDDKNRANFAKFERDDQVQIIIANEQRVSEGFNLQFCSRIIRSEAPWTPGEIEQTNSRIFRPDPAGFAKGKMTRNVIHLDWIICNNTIEVVKMAKLYRKIIMNCQYDEADNKDGQDGSNLYQSVMEMEPPAISLSRDLLLGRNLLKPDYETNYIDPYKHYVSIRNMDFDNMRKTKDASMLNMTPHEAPKEFRRIENVPLVYNQKVSDPHNFKYESFVNFLEHSDNAPFLKDINNYMIANGLMTKHLEKKKVKVTGVKVNDLPRFKKLNGKPFYLRYEGGYGRLIELGVAFRPDNPDACPVEFVKLETPNGAIAKVSLTETQAFVLNNIDQYNERIIKENKAILTDSDEEESRTDVVIDEILDDEDEEEVIKPVPKQPKDQKPKAPVVEEPTLEDEEEETVTKPVIQLIPTVYNEFFALEIQAEDDADNDAITRALSSIDGIKFDYVDTYAYINVHNKPAFSAILKYLLGKKFIFAQTCEKALRSVLEVFKKDGNNFSVEVAPYNELKVFHKLSLTMAKRDTLRLYPMVHDGKLQLMVDLSTNKEFRKEIVGHPINMITTQAEKKFVVAKGMHIVFASNKRQLMDIAITIKKSNLFDIANAASINDSFKSLKTHTGDKP